MTVDSRPDYAKLVHFLVEPFLDSSESLSVDCEQLNENQRVWVRLAFADQDKGKVFGRGGRNIQAIRTVLATTALAANQSLYLDIYGERNSSSSSRSRDSGERRSSSQRTDRGSSPRKPAPKLQGRS